MNRKPRIHFPGALYHVIARGLGGYLPRKLAGMRVKEIGRYFKREPMTISFGVRKIENLLQRDRGIAQRVEAMELNLMARGDVGAKAKYLLAMDLVKGNLGSCRESQDWMRPGHYIT
ncbi:MAG: hypothetical protein FJ117_21480 [Deltaproteobacteria bacterium]|nr:hypothetical protein [Deltaproteobacteria bacterium]